MQRTAKLQFTCLLSQAGKYKKYIPTAAAKAAAVFGKTEKWWKFFEYVENYTKRIGTKSGKLANFIKRFWESCTKAELK